MTMARVIAGDPQLADWKRRHARAEAILAVVRRSLPRNLATDIAIADADAAELRLSAPSGAFAAVLRQRGALLLSALVREGWEFTAIKVVVQPRNSAATWRKSSRIQWDSRANQPLVGLRDQLPPGPLKQALAKLVRGR
ncbi:MAG: hypothetical protein ABI190_08170 [Casimicrobiaceae bacterium]